MGEVFGNPINIWLPSVCTMVCTQVNEPLGKMRFDIWRRKYRKWIKYINQKSSKIYIQNSFKHQILLVSKTNEIKRDRYSENTRSKVYKAQRNQIKNFNDSPMLIKLRLGRKLVFFFSAIPRDMERGVLLEGHVTVTRCYYERSRSTDLQTLDVAIKNTNLIKMRFFEGFLRNANVICFPVKRL